MQLYMECRQGHHILKNIQILKCDFCFIINDHEPVVDEQIVVPIRFFVKQDNVLQRVF
jgi:hypothetical protein